MDGQTDLNSPDINLDDDMPTAINTPDLANDLLSDASLVQYNEQNKGFEAMVNEATKTKVQEQQEVKEQKKEKQFEVSPEEAIDYAVMMIEKVTTEASIRSGRDCRLGEEMTGLLAMSFAPLGQKYGKHIKKYFASNGQIDLDSRTPEIMAAAGATGLGGWVWWASHNGEELPPPDKEKDDKNKEEAKDGD